MSEFDTDALDAELREQLEDAVRVTGQNKPHLHVPAAGEGSEAICSVNERANTLRRVSVASIGPEWVSGWCDACKLAVALDLVEDVSLDVGDQQVADWYESCSYTSALPLEDTDIEERLDAAGKPEACADGGEEIPELTIADGATIEEGWYVLDEERGVVLDGSYAYHGQAMIALPDQEGEDLVVASAEHLRMLREQGDDLEFDLVTDDEPELYADGAGENRHYAEPGETLTLRNTVSGEEVTVTADRDGLVTAYDRQRGFSVDLWERVDDEPELVADGAGTGAGANLDTYRRLIGEDCPECGGPITEGSLRFGYSSIEHKNPDADPQAGHHEIDLRDVDNILAGVHGLASDIQETVEGERPGPLPDGVDATLEFADEFVLPIRRQAKTATVRYGSAHDIGQGDAVELQTTDGVPIERVRVRRTATAQAAEAHHLLELFNAEYPSETPQDVIDALNEHYDGVRPGAIVRVICWEPLEVSADV